MNVIDGRDLVDSLLADDPAPPAQTTTAVRAAFTIKRFVLHLLLERAAVAVPTRDVMPVLKHFQIEAAPDRLRVVASDLELSMIAVTELVTVTTPGTIVMPARKMLDILREAEDADVTITVAGDTAHIAIGRTSWRLRLLGGEDYPPMPASGDAAFVAFDRLDFLASLRAVRYAACKDGERASLMMIDVRDGQMTACDGVRFQQAAVARTPFDFQIPIGAVADLIKLLQSVEQPSINVGVSEHHLIFRFGNDEFIANKLAAKFPDMTALLLRPALANQHRLVVDRAQLLTAVKRVRINADPETSAIALTLTPGQIDVQARDKYQNAATETIPAEWNGAERTIVVNHSFLADMINGCQTPTLDFRLGDDKKTAKAPIMLTDPDTGTVGVVQQMNGAWLS